MALATDYGLRATDYGYVHRSAMFPYVSCSITVSPEFDHIERLAHQWSVPGRSDPQPVLTVMLLPGERVTERNT